MLPRRTGHAGHADRSAGASELGCGLGSPLRHVAYELGLAESTVSETLARAIRKLGMKSRTELIELHASIVGP